MPPIYKNRANAQASWAAKGHMLQPGRMEVNKTCLRTLPSAVTSLITCTKNPHSQHRMQDSFETRYHTDEADHAADLSISSCFLISFLGLFILYLSVMFALPFAPCQHERCHGVAVGDDIFCSLCDRILCREHYDSENHLCRYKGPQVSLLFTEIPS